MALATSNIKDVFTQFASAVMGRGFYLVLQVVLARSLGPHDYGLYAIGWTVAGLLGTFAPAGMPQAMLRFNLAGRGSLWSLPLLLTAVMGSVLAVAMLASADLIAGRVFGDPEAAAVIRAFAPAVPLASLLMVLAAALRASGAMLSSALVSGLLFAAYLALTVLAFAVAPSTVAAAHMYTIAILVALALAVILLLPHKPTSSAVPPRTLVHFGLVTMFIHSANVFNLWADRVVVGVMADPATLGVYQAASQLAMVVIVLRSAVTVVFEASVPKTGTGDAGVPNVSSEFFAAARILLHACGPGLVFLAITAGFWIDLLFGPSFSSASTALAILVVGQLAVTFCGPSITALHMTGKERLVMTLTMAGCLLNLVGNFFLIPPLGAAGAALGAAVANIAVAVGCLLVLSRSRRLSFSARQFYDIMAGLSACAVVSLFFVSIAGEMTLVKIIPMVLACYSLYLLVIYKFCRVDDEVLDFIRHATGRYVRRQA